MIDSFVVRTVGLFVAVWSAAVSVLMMVASDTRFNSPQWKFVEFVPGGHDTFGALILAASMVLLVGLFRDSYKLIKWSSYAIAFVYISLASAQGAAAAGEVVGGVMAGPSNFFIGMCFLFLGGIIKLKRGPSDPRG